MSVRKRNEFLEDDESDAASDLGYDSEAVEESRGAIASRATKRRKIDEEVSDEEAFAGLEDDSPVAAAYRDALEEQVSTARDADDGLDNLPDIVKPGKMKSTLKPPSLKQAEAAEKAARRSGVVYISRVPPFMKPQTLKHFLAPHAPKGLGKIFLSPEDHVTHTRRVKNGGNKKKSFTDGWVEFASKRDAKIVVETLNGNIIGGKKGNFYHDDLWSMKYLKGFKWSHLTEQIANENAERAARMKEEIRRSRIENKRFLDDLEHGKMVEGMEKKRKAKKLRGGGVEEAARKPALEDEVKQRKVLETGDRKIPPLQGTRVQSLIF
jgi:ESF2/ABP1 family protein